MRGVYLKSVCFMVVFSAFVAGCDDDDSSTAENQGRDTGGDQEDTATESGEGTENDSGGTDSDSAGECDGVSDVRVGVLEQEIALEGQVVTKKVNTVLMVSWDQTTASDSVKLRFTFENDEWYESPDEPGTAGAHEIPVFGVPELTEVEIQIVNETDGDETVCETTGTTGALPESVPRATVRELDPSLASENRWLLGTVEKTPEIMSMYEGIFTVYIIDRQGRIVWYYLDQAWSPVTAYPRIARDGNSFYFDRSTYLGSQASNHPSIARTTLDFRQFEQIAAPSMTDSMDITDDGGFVYNSEEWLIELTADGEERQIWSCTAWVEEIGLDLELLHDKLEYLGKLDLLDEIGEDKLEKIRLDACYANSVVWNPLEDAVLLSFPGINTVVEVSRQSGELVGQWGDVPGSWQLIPETTGFEFEHGANITPEGTLLVSTRETGIEDEFSTKPEHYFLEFALDRENRIATEIWRFGDGLTDWPACKGEVFPVPGGNRIANYGTAGIIRELTPDLEVAWDVKWDTEFEVPEEVMDLYKAYTEDDVNNMVGHDILIDDLYALNKGWESK
jgi:hypothetical protein